MERISSSGLKWTFKASGWTKNSFLFASMASFLVFGVDSPVARLNQKEDWWQSIGEGRLVQIRQV